MVGKVLVEELFEYGLGELLALHAHDQGPLLGQIVLDKGRMVLKDRRLLKDVKTPQVGPCYDIGIVGAVCFQPGHEWKSLTFVGPERCNLTQDLSSTRVNLMTTSTNEFNERLIDFQGSVYRGFKLMLDNHFLPVVLMHEVTLKDGGRGLAVSNLRMAGISFDILGEIHEHLQELVAPHVSFEVQDMTMESDDFATLFGQYSAA